MHLLRCDGCTLSSDTPRMKSERWSVTEKIWFFQTDIWRRDDVIDFLLPKEISLRFTVQPQQLLLLLGRLHIEQAERPNRGETNTHTHTHKTWHQNNQLLPTLNEQHRTHTTCLWTNDQIHKEKNNTAHGKEERRRLWVRFPTWFQTTQTYGAQFHCFQWVFLGSRLEILSLAPPAHLF